MKKMICPKCHFEQPYSQKCVSCGIIFSKYKRPRPKKSRYTPPKIERRSGFKLWASLSAIVLVPCLMLIFYTRTETAPQNPVPDKETVVKPLPSPDISPIENALSSLVTIKTPWGEGYGFFIDEDGYILTSRQLVTYENNHDDPTWKTIHTLNKKKLNKERKIERLLEEMDRRSFLDDALIGYEERIEQLEEEIQIIDEKIDEFDTPPKVFLPDGTELSIVSTSVLDDFPVALIRVPYDPKNSHIDPIMTGPDEVFLNRVIKRVEGVYLLGKDHEQGNVKALNYKFQSGGVIKTNVCFSYVYPYEPVIPIGSPLINDAGKVVGVCVQYHLSTVRVAPILDTLDAFGLDRPKG